MTNLILAPAAYFNVKAAGAKGDGISDDTPYIAAARAEARSAGGGVIFYPAGTYISGNQDISNDVGIYHVGCGRKASVIKLKNGANTDLFSAQTSLIGVSSSTGTLYNFGFSNMTLDGNKTNQSSGPSWPLRFYGYSYTFENLEVRNGYSGNILSDWNAGNSVGSADSMESQWVNVKSHGSAGMGIDFRGPHDSQFVNVLSFENVSHSLRIGPNAGGSQFTNFHAYGAGFTPSIATPVYGKDTFVRANQSGWGTADSGQVWSVVGTVTPTISGNKGHLSTGGKSRILFGSATVADIDIMLRLNQGSNASNVLGAVWRYQDTNNLYHAEVFSGTVFLNKRVAGTDTQLTTISMGFGNNVDGWLHIQMYGSQLRISSWQDGSLEPSSWGWWGTDTQFSSAGQFGVYTDLADGNAFVDSFAATTVTPTPTNVLLEAPDCHFNGNCTADTTPAGPNVVVLASGLSWNGGWIQADPSYPQTGIQIGVHANNPIWSGQLSNLSGSLTTDTFPSHCRVITRINHCEGYQGAINMDADGGSNYIDTIVDQNNGREFTGSFSGSTFVNRIYQNLSGSTTGAANFPGPVQVGGYSTIYSGTGAPSSGTGSNGDFYFRIDTPGTANQRLYVKSGGSWSGIL